jgi:two-component system, cell cycle response regulator
MGKSLESTQRIGVESRPKKILVVDDDEDCRRILELILQREFQSSGIEVLKASDGREAITIAGLKQPDLIITDIVMPGLDGLDALRSLKKVPETRHIPVIMLSVRNDVVSASIAAGAVAYLGKPYSPRELITQVRSVLLNVDLGIYNENA